MAHRRPKVVAEFIDAYEETREVHVDRRGRMRMKRTREIPCHKLSNACGILAGARIRTLRKERGWTMLELATRAGLTPSKERMKDIEMIESIRRSLMEWWWGMTTLEGA